MTLPDGTGEDRSRRSAASASRRNRRPGSRITRASAAAAAADAAAAAARRRRRRRGGRRRRRRRRRRARRGGRGRTRGEKRKDPGADLIIRNLATGDEVTVPEVNEYDWNKNGDWIAYAVSSTDAAKDGAFARRISRRRGQDAAHRPRPLQGPRVRRGRHAARVPERRGGLRAEGLAVSPLLLEGRRRRRPTGARRRPRRPACRRHGRQRIRRAALLEGRRAPLPRHRRRRPPPPADPNDKTPAPIKVDLWNYKDPLIQPMQKVRDAAGARAHLPRGRPSRRQEVRAARDAGHADREPGRRSDARDRHVGPAVPPGISWDQATTTSTCSI